MGLFQRGGYFLKHFEIPLIQKSLFAWKRDDRAVRLSSLHTGCLRWSADWAQVHGPISSWCIRFRPRLLGGWSITETGTVPRPKAAVATVGC